MPYETTARLAPSTTSTRLRADGGAPGSGSGYTERIHHMNAGNDRPPIRAQLIQDGQPVPLDTTADSADERVSHVMFEMWSPDETLVERRAEIDGEADGAGAVRYEWGRGETDLPPADYDARFTVRFADGSELSFPNTGSFVVTIHGGGP